MLRRVVTGALEIERTAKRIGSSLAAEAVIYAAQEDHTMFKELDAADIFITSGARFSDNEAPPGAFSLPEVDDVHVAILPASGDKCSRCWKILPEIGAMGGYAELCGRCANVVDSAKVL